MFKDFSFEMSCGEASEKNVAELAEWEVEGMLPKALFG